MILSRFVRAVRLANPKSITITARVHDGARLQNRGATPFRALPFPFARILTLSLAGLAALLRARVERGWLDVELLTGSYERLRSRQWV